MAYDTRGTDLQPFKYNGKEFDTMHGLNQYDYHARQYDAPSGRFTTVDPLAEKYYSISPYAYCANNPINYIDPDGKQYGFPSPNTTSWQGAGADYIAQKTIKEKSSSIAASAFKEVITNTDLNDAIVIATTITRGSKAINADGTSTSTIDKVAAVAGVLIPVVSGSAVKNAIKGIGKALGIGGDATKNRVKLRKSTKDKIIEAAPKTDDGKFIDPNTLEPINGPYDIGHKTGEEWRKIMHQEKGSSRKEVLNIENNPELYQIENRNTNRSHKYEDKNK